MNQPTYEELKQQRDELHSALKILYIHAQFGNDVYEGGGSYNGQSDNYEIALKAAKEAIAKVTK